MNKKKKKITHQKRKILAVLIGLPCSGKTYYTQHTLFNYERISQDDMGKSYYKKFLQLLLDGKEHIVIDRVNCSIEQRLRFVLPAQRFGYKITYYFFIAPDNILLKRMRDRKGHPTVKSNDYNKHKELIEFFKTNYEEPGDLEQEFEMIEVKTGEEPLKEQ